MKLLRLIAFQKAYKIHGLASKVHLLGVILLTMLQCVMAPIGQGAVRIERGQMKRGKGEGHSESGKREQEHLLDNKKRIVRTSSDPTSLLEIKAKDRLAELRRLSESHKPQRQITRSSQLSERKFMRKNVKGRREGRQVRPLENENGIMGDYIQMPRVYTSEYLARHRSEMSQRRKQSIASHLTTNPLPKSTQSKAAELLLIQRELSNNPQQSDRILNRQKAILLSCNLDKLQNMEKITGLQLVQLYQRTVQGQKSLPKQVASRLKNDILELEGKGKEVRYESAVRILHELKSIHPKARLELGMKTGQTFNRLSREASWTVYNDGMSLIRNSESSFETASIFRNIIKHSKRLPPGLRVEARAAEGYYQLNEFITQHWNANTPSMRKDSASKMYERIKNRQEGPFKLAKELLRDYIVNRSGGIARTQEQSSKMLQISLITTIKNRLSPMYPRSSQLESIGMGVLLDKMLNNPPTEAQRTLRAALGVTSYDLYDHIMRNTNVVVKSFPQIGKVKPIKPQKRWNQLEMILKFERLMRQSTIDLSASLQAARQYQSIIKANPSIIKVMQQAFNLPGSQVEEELSVLLRYIKGKKSKEASHQKATAMQLPEPSPIQIQMLQQAPLYHQFPPLYSAPIVISHPLPQPYYYQHFRMSPIQIHTYPQTYAVGQRYLSYPQLPSYYVLYPVVWSINGGLGMRGVGSGRYASGGH